MTDTASITFRVTEDEWVQFAREVRDHYGIWAYYPWKQVIVYTLVPVAVVIFDIVVHANFPGAPFLPRPPTWSFWIALIMIVAIPIAYLAWALLQATVSMKHWLRRGDTRDAVGEQTITLEPETLRWIIRSGDHAFRWTVVSEMVVTSSFIFMVVADQNLVIPKRLFDDPEQAEAFLNTARRYRKEAPPSELRCPKCRYDFTGATLDRCPECGWNRDPRKP